jgi:tRNA uridine 5-carboxymethylaminomethyl modification enzyme
MNLGNYDLIVVGAGHAGCEAAAAAANMGSSVMLITMNMETIAKMSCNPAMGGVAKGQIVREIDALGGYSGIITDKTMIQFRMLNRSKGPAMWSPRAQSDRMRFAEAWRLHLEALPNLSFFQDTVASLIIAEERVCGVVTQMGATIYSKAVVLTNGTFLNGRIHIGTKNFGGGRMGESAAKGITGQLIELGFTAGRMKTGTPPRVDGRTLDYSRMEEQAGDSIPGKFSFSRETSPLQHQKSCFITYTNEAVHDVLRAGFDESPMYNGSIQGVGPRYCPSIEDKINRFAERERHQIFVEPEGWDTVEIYVNGFSTSLPDHIQLKALQLIPGFEQAKIFRPGYAIEYDYFPPTQLYSTLETKLIRNLYFAGQINGTTGYEEAACQGLMAGINAHLRVHDKEPFILGRDQAYIGVLIDDLVNKGTDEPYRMFTSRAEYRILLRQDNADLRLTPLSHDIGLADSTRMSAVEKKQTDSHKILDLLQASLLHPNECNPLLETKSSSVIREKHSAARLLTRPQIDIAALQELPSIKPILAPFQEDALLEAEIQHKYAGYLDKEKEQAAKLLHLEHLTIPSKYDYMSVHALSMEARIKLQDIQPTTIGQASRISGVTPSDISILLIRFGR